MPSSGQLMETRSKIGLCYYNVVINIAHTVRSLAMGGINLGINKKEMFKGVPYLRNNDYVTYH